MTRNKKKMRFRHLGQVQLNYMVFHRMHVPKMVALVFSEGGVFGPLTSKGH